MIRVRAVLARSIKNAVGNNIYIRDFLLFVLCCYLCADEKVEFYIFQILDRGGYLFSSAWELKA